MDIIIIRNGIAHDWVLKFGRNKQFYLGQDIKFCRRVLGMEPGFIAREIGDNDLTKPSVRKRLAKFICRELNITKENVHQYNDWDFCAQ